MATAARLLPRGSWEGEEDWVSSRHPALGCGPAGASLCREPSGSEPRGLCVSVALGPTLASGQAASGLLLEQLALGGTVRPSFPSWGVFPCHCPQTPAPGVE